MSTTDILTTARQAAQATTDLRAARDASDALRFTGTDASAANQAVTDAEHAADLAEAALSAAAKGLTDDRRTEILDTITAEGYDRYAVRTVRRTIA